MYFLLAIHFHPKTEFERNWIIMSLCLAAASGKGGVGKSAFIANLAAVLAQRGNRVIIIDADIGLRSQDALLALENRVVYDLIDLADGDCLPDQAILVHDSIPGLHLLPAAQFARAKKLNPKHFRNIIDDLHNSYDYILIDSPAGIERGLRNVLNAGVDTVILVTNPDDISVRSAERAKQIIEEKKITDIRLLVNRVDQKLVRSGEMMSARTVSEVLDLPLLGEIPEDQTVYRSMLLHHLFIDYDCESRNAILRICSRLQDRNIPFPAYGSRKESLWSRFRSTYKPLKEVSPIDDH